MKEKININFFDIGIFTISIIFFLLIYTEEKSQTLVGGNHFSKDTICLY